MSRFLHTRYAGLETYTPGEQPRDKQYIKLNTNESPYPPSPEVLAALGPGEVADLRLYSCLLYTSHTCRNCPGPGRPRGACRWSR